MVKTSVVTGHSSGQVMRRKVVQRPALSSAAAS
jgi:hypothetical protein